MKTLLISFCILLGVNVYADSKKPNVKVESVMVAYEGKMVKAKKLTVSSEIPIRLDHAWNNVKTPALLQFVAKGMIKFKATDGDFPQYWEEGKTYGAKMRVFGFIPFGGTHYLYIEKIADDTHEISTKEWNKSTKIWNHDVIIRDLGNGKIYYEDSILIYGKGKTGFVTSFAKRFYKHRQRRWQKVAQEGLTFGA